MGFVVAFLVVAFGNPPPPAAGRYVYVENASRSVCLIRGEWRVCGHLDARGEFKETQRVLSAGPSFIGGVKIGQILNAYALHGKPLYELRAGRLVPGTFDKEGTFIQDIGGKVIDFAAYKYTPTAPKIWNLPGHFLTEPEAKRFMDAKRALEANPPPVGTPGFNFSLSPPRNKDWN